MSSCSRQNTRWNTQLNLTRKSKTGHKYLRTEYERIDKKFNKLTASSCCRLSSTKWKLFGNRMQCRSQYRFCKFLGIIVISIIWNFRSFQPLFIWDNNIERFNKHLRDPLWLIKSLKIFFKIIWAVRKVITHSKMAISRRLLMKMT